VSKLAVRTLTGIVFVAVITGAIWGGVYTFLTLFLLVMAGSLWEFLSIFNNAEIPVARIETLAVGSLLYLLTAGSLLEFYPPQYLWGTVPLILMVLIIELFRNNKAPYQNIALSLLGLLYITGSYLLLAHVALFPSDYHTYFLLSFFLLIWTNDTFAYLIGRFLGRTPLFPRISPKKTWEGTMGGLACTIGVGYLLAEYLHINYQFDWLIGALIVTIFGTLGDLLISMLKRQYDLDDAGSLLPGHGGLLDRFDGVMLVVPFWFSYIVLI
jgi:phosphatidate cytidylyltransferase